MTYIYPARIALSCRDAAHIIARMSGWLLSCDTGNQVPVSQT